MTIKGNTAAAQLDLNSLPALLIFAFFLWGKNIRGSAQSWGISPHTHTHIHTLIQCLYTAYTNTYWAYIQKSQRVPQLTLFTAPLLHRRVRGKISCPLFFFPSLWVPHSSIRCKDKRIWRQTLYPPLVSPHMQYTSSFSVSICWFGSDPSACQWTSLWYGDTRRQTAFT